MALLSRRTEQEPFTSMRRDVNTWLSTLFSTPFLARTSFPARGLFAPLDVRENNGDYVVRMDVPGVDENHLKITFRDNTLLVSGERLESREDSGGQLRYREVRYGNFQRSIPLPDHVDKHRISANYKDGVLIITIPKTNGSTDERRVEIARSA